MNNMYFIGIPIAPAHKQPIETESKAEANTYDNNHTNFENKGGTYDFGIHLPMKHMYSIAIIVAPAHKPTKEKQATAEASTYDYNDFNFENKSRTYDVAYICP